MIAESNRQRWSWFLLASLAALLFLPGLGNHGLWNPDEPRYAEVAREMLLTGDWSVPHVNGRLYAQKPPLHFWLIAAVGAMRGGVDEVAARLPTALAAIGTILLIFALGRRLFGERAAWYATAVFATGLKILRQGRFAQIDMLLVFLVTLAVWFWVRAEQLHERGDSRPHHLLFFLAAGLATLAKGPVGLLPPLLSILAFAALTRDRSILRRLRMGRGLLIWLAVVALWLLPATLSAGGEYLQQMVVKQNLTRYANPWHHQKPWYYYLTVIPGDFFPWSLLLPGAWIAARRELAGPRRRWWLFTLAWIVVTIVFFSLSPAKRTVYVLTMYPAMALAVGVGLDCWIEGWPRYRRWLLIPLALIALLATAGCIALPKLAAHQEATALLSPRLVPLAMATVATIGLGAAIGLLLALRGRPAHIATALAAAMATAGLAIALLLQPLLDPVKSARPLAMELLQRIGPDDRYATYPRLDANFVFYTQRFAVELHGEEELYRFASSPQRVWLLVERDNLVKLKKPLGLIEVARDIDLTEGYVLLTQPPAPSPPPNEGQDDAGAMNRAPTDRGTGVRGRP